MTNLTPPRRHLVELISISIAKPVCREAAAKKEKNYNVSRLYIVFADGAACLPCWLLMDITFHAAPFEMSNCATLPFKLVQHAVVHHVQRRQRGEWGWGCRPLVPMSAATQVGCCSLAPRRAVGKRERRGKKEKEQPSHLKMAEAWQQQNKFFLKRKKKRRKSAATLQLFCVNTRIFAGSISQEGRGGAAAMDHPAENFSENILLLREHSVISRWQFFFFFSFSFSTQIIPKSIQRTLA